MISKFIRAIRDLHSDVTEEEICDMLWLTAQTQSSSINENTTDKKKPLMKDQKDPSFPTDAPSSPSTTAEKKQANVHLPSTQDSSVNLSHMGGLPMRSPVATALPGSLELGRAFRPLMHRVPSHTTFMLDEAMSAQRIAEQILLQQPLLPPVLQPVSTRWLDVALVIDESSTMNIWRPTINEFKLMLERHGAFRDVRAWGITIDKKKNVILHTSWPSSDKRRQRKPNELIDPSGRRLIFIVSDCISPMWYNKQFIKTLEHWGHWGPLALVQVLPQRLWYRSTLSEAIEVVVHAKTPGVPNSQLVYEPVSYLTDKRDLQGHSPIPVLSLQADTIRHWVQSVMMANSTTGAAGYIFPIYDPPPIEHPLTNLSPKEQIQQFSVTASPLARHLLRLLASMPISLPTIRLIQHTMLPQSDLSHVAEILFSGLLEQISHHKDEYDFVAGVRDLLIAMTPKSESLEVIDAISNFIARTTGQNLNILALLENPDSINDLTISENSLPFATITARVFEKLGGQYKEPAKQIKKKIESQTQLQTTSFKREISEMPLPEQQATAENHENILSSSSSTHLSALADIENTFIDKNVQQLHQVTQELYQHTSSDSMNETNHLHWQPPLMLPPRAQPFVGREKNLMWLLKMLNDKAAGAILAICGPGGMGKTALAAEALNILIAQGNFFTHFPDGIFYHSFYAYPSLTVAYESLARAFGEEPGADPHGAAIRVLSRHRHALLVFDGVEALESARPLHELGGENIVLLLSRRQADAPDPAYRLDVTSLTQDEAVALIQKIGGPHLADHDSIAQLVKLVGGYPLALQLIGNYLHSHHEEVIDYLQWFEQEKLHTLRHGEHQYQSVLLILQRTYTSLAHTEQQVMKLLGLIAPTPFPAQLIQDILEVPKQVALRALGSLVNLNVLQRSDQSYEVSHPLVHTFAVNLLASETASTQTISVWQVRLLTTLTTYFDQNNPYDRVALALWQPHVLTLFSAEHLTAEQALKSSHLFSTVAAATFIQGHYSEAEPLLEHALMIHEQVLGSSHPDTAQSLNNLAELYQAQGKYKEAEPLLLRALTIREQLLGNMHPDTAQSLNNLARLYQAQGKYKEAESLYGKALSIYEQQSESSHPDTAQSLNNLAELYQAQGKYEEAEPLLLRALAIREQLLGNMHPDAAQSLNNLAGLYQAQGKYEEAESLLLRALAIREQLLGNMHPDAAQSLNNLAGLYQAQGKYEEAKSLYGEALSIYEQQLGSSHPHTAQSLNNLAELYQAQGKYEEAESLLLRALAIREQLLGNMHPDTAQSLNNLAELYQAQGKYEEAEPLLLRALTIREQLLGNMHPDTVQSLNNLAASRESHHVIETNPPTQERKIGEPEEPVNLLEFLQKRIQRQTPYQTTTHINRLRPVWSTTSGLTHVYYSEPTVANGIIYASTYNSTNWSTASPMYLRALDISTGEHLWSYKTQYDIFEAPVVSEGLIYFASGNIEDGGKVSALDAETGELYWTVETENNLKATPIVSNDIVYAYSRHAIYALDAATGQQYWNVALKSPLQGRPMIANRVVYIATKRGHCYAVDAKSGHKLASYADVGQVYAVVSFNNDVVCICVYNDQLYALDMQTGETYWSISLENGIAHEIEIVNGIAYLNTQGTFGNSTARTRLFAMELATGKQLWSAYLKNEVDATPLVVDGIIYLTTKSAELYMLDAQNGKLIQPLKLYGDKISRPCVANGWVIITNNEINAFQLL